MSDVTVIGRDTFIRGNVRGEGDLEIHGRVEGEIEIAGAVTVVAGALVKADISARAIVVGGALVGNLTAEELLRLEEGSRVVGDLRAPTIGVAEGALFRGNIETDMTAEKPAERERPAAAAVPERRATIASRTASRPIERRQASPARPAAEKPSRPEPSRPLQTRVVPVAAAKPAPVERKAAAAPAPAPSTPPATPSSKAPKAEAEPAPASAKPSTEETAPESSEREAPPPPVVPALKKGAKAAIKKKAR